MNKQIKENELIFGPRIPKVHRLLLRMSIVNGFSPRMLLRILGDNPRVAIRALGAVPIKYAAFMLGYVRAVLTSDRSPGAERLL